ncbi:hypothetical protein Vretimale_8836 [Volvox reticuliferus]|uniref:RRM domain-containing protein n=2 Tax=Volvox reticuliferus TaxID=1737510 RepID=A0A8J4LPC7_9CHLO|nr:hypothetical protein Vretifemale_6216 [Volvox reticuliferus]GIM04254.1 hypothetical protein Vretimale_8836 [Volvox reticuliferus]
MEFDFEEGINGAPQSDIAHNDHLIAQQQADPRGQGYPDGGTEPSVGPMGPFDQLQPHQQQQQQPDQQPQQVLGPSIQALREARDAGGQVYVANLTWWTTDLDVESVCSSFGAVNGLQFVEDRATGRSRGAVLVEFADPEAAARCKEQLSGKPINGRPCVVTFAGSSSGSGKAGPSHRPSGPTPAPPGSHFLAGPGVPVEGRAGSGRGGYGGRGPRGGRGGRGGGDRGDRGGVGGGVFGVPGQGPMPQEMPGQLGMPPLGPLGPHGPNNFLGAMAAAAAASNPLSLLPSLLAGGVGPMGVGPMGGVPGPMGGMPGGHHGMGGPVGPHGHPMGGPGGHFMPDM